MNRAQFGAQQIQISMQAKTRIVVASQNPVKSGAIEGAYRLHFPDHEIHVQGCSAASGVSDQPMSEEETRLGALNRLAAIRKAEPDADVWAALEGGVHETDDGLVGFAWIVVETSDCRGAARTATFPLPEKVATLVRAGTELGHVNDVVFGRENSKQKEGAIGILTNGLIDRRMLYEHAAVFAMVPIKQAKLFSDLG